MVLELQNFVQALASIAIEQAKFKEKFENRLIEIKVDVEAIIKEFEQRAFWSE